MQRLPKLKQKRLRQRLNHSFKRIKELLSAMLTAALLFSFIVFKNVIYVLFYLLIIKFV